MSCQITRKDKKIDKVLSKNLEESVLYNDILEYVKKNDVESIIKKIPYLSDRLNDGLLLDKSNEEIALGLWSIIYTPEFKGWVDNYSKNVNKVFDDNDEPLFEVFKNAILSPKDKTEYKSPSSVLTESQAEFAMAVKGIANSLQKKIIDVLFVEPDNKVILEEENHVYYDLEGEVYMSTTTAINGTSEQNPEYEINRLYGIAFDTILQGIIRNKSKEDCMIGENELSKKALATLTADNKTHAYNMLRIYVNTLISDGSVIVTQVVVSSKAHMIAGSLDLLVISPKGKLKIVDLKVSKDSSSSNAHNKSAYPVKDGTKLKGKPSLTKRQKHGIQVGVYKKLIELMGIPVEGASTFHITLKLNASDKTISDISVDDNNIIDHPDSLNRKYVDEILPGKIPNESKFESILEELGLNNPTKDPDFLTEEEALPKEEGSTEASENHVKDILDRLKKRKKFIEESHRLIDSFKSNKDIVNKLTELIAYMYSEEGAGNSIGAYGKFLRESNIELEEVLEYINDDSNKKEKDYLAVLLRYMSYVKSYRDLLQIGNVGVASQGVLLDKLNKNITKANDAINENFKIYVKQTIQDNVHTKDYTDEELVDIVTKTSDISLIDYGLDDMDNSTDTILAVVAKIYKKGVYQTKVDSDIEIDKIRSAGNKLFKALGITKKGKTTYDFMWAFDKFGKKTGRYIQKVSQLYWDRKAEVENKIKNKKYIEISDLNTSTKADLDFNIELQRDKQEKTEFILAEKISPTGVVSDGAYHKYTDEFKKIRLQYQEIEVRSEGYSYWVQKQGVSDFDYAKFQMNYFTKVGPYLTAEFEANGDYKGKTKMSESVFVKNEYVEIRDVSASGENLVNEKYKKLMNPVTELEKAQSEYFKIWVAITESKTGLLDIIDRRSMSGKIPRVPMARIFLDRLSKAGTGAATLIAKNIRNEFSSITYDNSVFADEMGTSLKKIPVQFINDLKNQTVINRIKKDISDLQDKKKSNSVSLKEYTENMDKLKNLLRYEENKLDVEEIETDLTENLIHYIKMAENFKIMDGISDTMSVFEEVITAKDYISTDNKGNPFMNKTISGSGESINKDKGDVFVIKRFHKYMKMVFYNDEDFNKNTYQILAKKLQNFTSLKAMGLNPFAALNNYVMGRINNSIETAGALYYDRKAMNSAVMDYNKNYLPGIFSKIPMMSSTPYEGEKAHSKYEALVSHFNFITKYQEDAGKIESMGWAYFMSEGGEYNLQSKVGVAILKTKELTNSKTGETLSIYDAFNFKDGVLALKDGFEFKKDEEFETSNYIKEVNKIIHGNYAKSDRMVIQDHWLGDLAAQFHKWLYPMYKSRFKKRYHNINLGEMEGRYLTVWELLKYMHSTEGGLLTKMKSGWNDLTEFQKKNMYKNATELAFFASSFVLYALMSGLAGGLDDDDEVLKKLANWFMYQQTRIQGEILTLVPVLGIKSQWGLIKSPIASTSTAHDFGEVLLELIAVPFSDDIYFKKGVNKGRLRVVKEAQDITPFLTHFNRWKAFETTTDFYIR